MVHATTDGTREFTIRGEVTDICAELGIADSGRIWARLLTWECPVTRDAVRLDVIRAARIEGIDTLEGAC